MDFFRILYERFFNENSLSDITYVLCESNENFKKIFLKYCFEEDFTDVEIQREFSKDDCRPDFYVKNLENNKEYILESKIYDKNIHPEYKMKFKDMTRSFIANYNAKGFPCNAEKTYDFVKSWYGFVPYIQESCGKKDDLLCGYIEYLKRSIDYLEVKSMNLLNVKSLPVFGRLLEKIVKSIQGKHLVFNNNKPGIKEGNGFGKWIKYKDKRTEKQFWMGIYFDHEDEDPYFCLNYDGFSGKSEGKYYYTESPAYLEWLYLKGDLNERLLIDNNIEEQEEIITNFLLEFLEQI
jgi:elongation factor P hydroxylase